MGCELNCALRMSGNRSNGKALLEANEIVFRGDQRLKIPVASLESVVVRNGELHLKWPGNAAVFELGDQAEKWAHKILHPKSTAEKLGIKAGLRISVLQLSEDGFSRDARSLAAAFSNDKTLRDSDLIFFGAELASDLAEVKKLVPYLAGNGAVWIVYLKGRKEITEIQVLNAGREAGLIDVKVVSYSATHTALKFVRPKAKR